MPRARLHRGCGMQPLAHLVVWKSGVHTSQRDAGRMCFVQHRCAAIPGGSATIVTALRCRAGVHRKCPFTLRVDLAPVDVH